MWVDRTTVAGQLDAITSRDLHLNSNRNDSDNMLIAGLATTTCLAVCVSGAAVFRYAADTPRRKRQLHLLDDIGLASGITRTPSYLLPTTSTTTVTSSSLHEVATTKPSFSDVGDILFPPDSQIAVSTSGSSSVSSTASPLIRSHTSTSILESAVAIPTPSTTLTVSPSMDSTPPDITSWIPAASPSPTFSVPPSAVSASSTWKTVGIAVSVLTLIGLTILLVVFFEQWTAFVRDVFLCRSRDRDPLGDEEFLPDKYHEDCDAGPKGYNRTWAREIRESARLSNVRYPTDVFYGDGSALGPGKAGIGAGGGAGRNGAGVGEFGQLDRPSRPSFLQRLSMLSLRSPSPVSPRFGTNGHSLGTGDTVDGLAVPTLSPPKASAI